METTSKVHVEIEEGVVTFTRVFDAPRELVWEAWTNPEYVKRWWGPDGFSLTTTEMEVSPNGIWRFMMHGPDGKDYPNRVRFTEVRRPEKLAYEHTDDDDPARISFQVTITFLEQGNSTKLIMRSDCGSEQELKRLDEENGAIKGGVQHLDRLAAVLADIAE